MIPNLFGWSFFLDCRKIVYVLLAKFPHIKLLSGLQFKIFPVKRSQDLLLCMMEDFESQIQLSPLLNLLYIKELHQERKCHISALLVIKVSIKVLPMCMLIIFVLSFSKQLLTREPDNFKISFHPLHISSQNSFKLSLPITQNSTPHQTLQPTTPKPHFNSPKLSQKSNFPFAPRTSRSIFFAVKT
jgi:hypothetical protein